MNYNLLKEKWIPVLWKDRDTNPVSIIEALTKAGFIPAAKACLCAVDEEVLQVKLTLKIQ